MDGRGGREVAEGCRDAVRRVNGGVGSGPRRAVADGGAGVGADGIGRVASVLRACTVESVTRVVGQQHAGAGARRVRADLGGHRDLEEVIRAGGRRRGGRRGLRSGGRDDGGDRDELLDEHGVLRLSVNPCVGCVASSAGDLSWGVPSRFSISGSGSGSSGPPFQVALHVGASFLDQVSVSVSARGDCEPEPEMRARCDSTWPGSEPRLALGSIWQGPAVARAPEQTLAMDAPDLDRSLEVAPNPHGDDFDARDETHTPLVQAAPGPSATADEEVARALDAGVAVANKATDGEMLEESLAVAKAHGGAARDNEDTQVRQLDRSQEVVSPNSDAHDDSDDARAEDCMQLLPPPTEAEVEVQAATGAEAAAEPEAAEPEAAAEEAAVAAARTQADGLVAVRVHGHLNGHTLDHNAIFRRQPDQPMGGWPQYVLARDLGEGGNLYLFRHVASGRWVLNPTTQVNDLEGLATILAPEGPIPLDGRSWRHAGEDVRLTVKAFATEMAVDASIQLHRDLDVAGLGSRRRRRCSATKKCLATKSTSLTILSVVVALIAIVTIVAITGGFERNEPGEKSRAEPQDLHATTKGQGISQKQLADGVRDVTCPIDPVGARVPHPDDCDPTIHSWEQRVDGTFVLAKPSFEPTDEMYSKAILDAQGLRGCAQAGECLLHLNVTTISPDDPRFQYAPTFTVPCDRAEPNGPYALCTSLELPGFERRLRSGHVLLIRYVISIPNRDAIETNFTSLDPVRTPAFYRAFIHAINEYASQHLLQVMSRGVAEQEPLAPGNVALCPGNITAEANITARIEKDVAVDVFSQRVELELEDSGVCVDLTMDEVGLAYYDSRMPLIERWFVQQETDFTLTSERNQAQRAFDERCDVDYHLGWLPTCNGTDRRCSTTECNSCDVPRAVCAPTSSDTAVCACIESEGFDMVDNDLLPAGMYGRREPHSTCAKSFVAMCGHGDLTMYPWINGPYIHRMHDPKTYIWDKMFKTRYGDVEETMISCPAGCTDGLVYRSSQGTYTTLSNGIMHGRSWGNSRASHFCSAALNATGIDGGFFRVRKVAALPVPPSEQCATVDAASNCAEALSLGLSCTEFSPGGSFRLVGLCNHICELNNYDSRIVVNNYDSERDNTCEYAHDGECDDGSTGGTQHCASGTDVGDCDSCASHIDAGALTCEDDFGPGDRFAGSCDFECGFCGGAGIECGVGAEVVALRSEDRTPQPATVVNVSDNGVLVEWKQDDSCAQAHDGICTCADDQAFVDEQGYVCSAWTGYNCDDAVNDYGYTKQGMEDLLSNCPLTCGVCCAIHTDATDCADAPEDYKRSLVVFNQVHCLPSYTIAHEADVQAHCDEFQAPRLPKDGYDVACTGNGIHDVCTVECRPPFVPQLTQHSAQLCGSGRGYFESAEDCKDDIAFGMYSCSGGQFGVTQWMYHGKTRWENYERPCNYTAACESCKNLPVVFNPFAQPPIADAVGCFKVLYSMWRSCQLNGRPKPEASMLAGDRSTLHAPVPRGPSTHESKQAFDLRPHAGTSSCRGIGSDSGNTTSSATGTPPPNETETCGDPATTWQPVYTAGYRPNYWSWARFWGDNLVRPCGLFSFNQSVWLQDCQHNTAISCKIWSDCAYLGEPSSFPVRPCCQTAAATVECDSSCVTLHGEGNDTLWRPGVMVREHQLLQPRSL